MIPGVSIPGSSSCALSEVKQCRATQASPKIHVSYSIFVRCGSCACIVMECSSRASNSTQLEWSHFTWMYVSQAATQQYLFSIRCFCMPQSVVLQCICTIRSYTVYCHHVLAAFLRKRTSIRCTKCVFVAISVESCAIPVTSRHFIQHLGVVT